MQGRKQTEQPDDNHHQEERRPTANRKTNRPESTQGPKSTPGHGDIRIRLSVYATGSVPLNAITGMPVPRPQ